MARNLFNKKDNIEETEQEKEFEKEVKKLQPITKDLGEKEVVILTENQVILNNLDIVNNKLDLVMEGLKKLGVNF